MNADTGELRAPRLLGVFDERFGIVGTAAAVANAAYHATGMRTRELPIMADKFLEG